MGRLLKKQSQPRSENADTSLLWLRNQGTNRNKLADEPFFFGQMLDIIEGKLINQYNVSFEQT